MCRGIDHQELARSARRSEDQCLILSTEDPAGLRASGNGCQVAQALPIDDLNGAGCRIGDEYATTLEVHVPVIEVTLRMWRQINVVAQDQFACHRCSPSFSL